MFLIYFVLNLSFPILAIVKIYQIVYWILLNPQKQIVLCKSIT